MSRGGPPFGSPAPGKIWTAPLPPPATFELPDGSFVVLEHITNVTVVTAVAIGLRISLTSGFYRQLDMDVEPARALMQEIRAAIEAFHHPPRRPA